MSKLFKIFYRLEDDIDCNCLDKCPFNESPMCGSYACLKCKYCIGSGNMSVWDLSKHKGVNFNQGYIICKKVYTKPTLKMYIMGIIHKLKYIN